MSGVVPDQQSFEAFRWVVALIVPAVAGLVGVVIGAWLNSFRERKQRQLAYLEKQISSFYSPMIGLRQEVRAHGSLRVQIQNEASAAWTELCANSAMLDIQLRTRIESERGREFARIIEYDNTKLHEDLLPAYRKMLALFRENYWLTEPETQRFYPEVVQFVEIWNRWVGKSLPTEVLKRLEHSEENLTPFYEHNEQQHDVIRQKLKVGKA